MKFVYGKQDLLSQQRAQENCWLLANGLGGFASTSAAFSVTRCDQGLLIAAKTPNERYTLVHRLSEQLTVQAQSVFLSSQSFAGERLPEEGWRYLSAFLWENGPKWLYQVDGVQITRQCALVYGENTAAVVYEVENRSEAPCTLQVKPVLQFSQKGNPPQEQIRLEYAEGRIRGAGLTLYVKTNGALRPLAQEQETLFYADDEKDGRRATGLGFSCFSAELTVSKGESHFLELVFSTEVSDKAGSEIIRQSRLRQQTLLERSGFRSPVAQELARSADAFIASRPSAGGKTILAGFPFFGDWGRDTMIALPGCVLSTGQYETAKSILRTFLAYERDGLVPNLFPEGQAQPRYNTVDAALLLVNCVWLYYCKTNDAGFIREAWPCLVRIIRAYQRGTHFAIGMDSDALIRAGEGLDQVTWMDVCVDGILPTPRHGKPVEINAYWYNALCILSRLSPIAGEGGEIYRALAEQVKTSFLEKFWIADKGYLKDVLSGTSADEQIRCNQIWAVSLPFTMLDAAQERQVVDTVYRHLYTPCGLRTLSPTDPEFHPFYGGSQRDRDLAYHQGTVWPFPLGAYYLAYLKTQSYTVEAAARVREQLEPLEAMLREGCVGQLPEIYDGEAPGPSKGCFAQAWSVGELLRVYEALEKIETDSCHPRKARRRTNAG